MIATMATTYADKNKKNSNQQLVMKTLCLVPEEYIRYTLQRCAINHSVTSTTLT